MISLSAKIEVEVLRDSEGYPSLVNILKKNRKLTVTFDKDQGFTFEGETYGMLPKLKEILDLVYPAELEAKLVIPEPLEVLTIPSGGKSVLFDDMESLLKWSQDSGTVSLDNTHAFAGDQSLKLLCGAADTDCKSTRYFNMPPSGRIAVSFNWMLNDYSKLNYLDVAIYREDGVNQIIGGFRAFQSYYDLIIQGGNKTIHKFYPYTNGDINGPWNRSEVWFDFNAKLHERFIANDTLMELGDAGWPLRVSTTTNNHSYILIELNNVAGNEIIGWIDDFRITEYN